MPKGERGKFDTDNDFFENMTKAVFIMGFSREVVIGKWEGFKAVFDNFDINKVAAWDQGKIMEVVEDNRIVRNLKKIEATVFNAKKLQEIVKENGSVKNYIRSLDTLPYEKRLKEIAKSFKMLGPRATTLTLWLSGEYIEEM